MDKDKFWFNNERTDEIARHMFFNPKGAGEHRVCNFFLDLKILVFQILTNGAVIKIAIFEFSVGAMV